MKSFIFAIQFLTRIPLAADIAPDEKLARRSLALFPLVGWLIGGILYCLCVLIMLPGKLAPVTVAALLVAAETFLTGAFHLDGLTDTFDAFFSTGKTREQKLEIMKDSHIGAMGAVALIITLLLKVTLISECIRYDLKAYIAIYPAMGRFAQVALYKTSPYVRRNGIGLIFSKAAGPRAFWFGIALLCPSMLAQTPHLIAAYALYGAFVWLFARYSESHIGGITGDVLGSATVLSEIVFLASFPVSLFLQWAFLQLIISLSP